MTIRHLAQERSRHGRIVYYARIGGRRKRIDAQPDDEAFLDLFKAALAALKAGADAEPEPATRPAPAQPRPGSLAWLIRRYLAESADYIAMKPEGRARRRRILTEMAERLGDKPMLMPTAAIEAGFAARRAKPGAANNWLKSVKALYSWAVKVRIAKENPAAPIRKARLTGAGFHIWTIEEIAAFARRHPPGSQGWLTLMLLLFTGLRREDASRLGRQHVSGGVIRFTTGKTGAALVTAVARPLAAAIESRGPTGELPFLLTTTGKPFASGNAFGNWFKDRCREAGLPHCTAHGLRKAGASIAAEMGATDHQLDAMFTWSPPDMSRTYTRAARRLKLASEGFALIETALTEAGIVPRDSAQTRHIGVAPFPSHLDGATKTGG